MSTMNPTRRRIIQAGAFALAAPSFIPALAKEAERRFKKAVKIGMIEEGKTLLEKFQILKQAGFEGVELNSPGGPSKDEALAASQSTGIVIHGVVNGISWNPRLSDPDPTVRQKALDNLTAAMHECKGYGAATVLLVPGAVRDPKNENYDQVWERSTEQIHKAEPLAKELGVKIAVEVVWNDFLTKPEQLVKFVDQFDAEAVGAYFDPSNVTKYGVPPATWIRQLGKRMLKFDFKGYHMEKQWVEIGQGSEDWPEIRKALKEIGYEGWATSEITGGGLERLKTLAAQMDSVLYG